MKDTYNLRRAENLTKRNCLVLFNNSIPNMGNKNLPPTQHNRDMGCQTNIPGYPTIKFVVIIERIKLMSRSVNQVYTKNFKMPKQAKEEELHVTENKSEKLLKAYLRRAKERSEAKKRASIGPPGIYNLYVLGYPKISKYIHNWLIIIFLSFTTSRTRFPNMIPKFHHISFCHKTISSYPGHTELTTYKFSKKTLSFSLPPLMEGKTIKPISRVTSVWMSDCV
ncbi:hypothetical protein NQ317_008871 [Molorchus minor]|uniref:Uncharacterized protein n=1 Tax=Molorchus minor TaxID=1323400 RepID=A0ABQ9J6H7_9CUCU|nr:hypothetical protein NQ317_008871 [Molorchus minor]